MPTFPKIVLVAVSVAVLLMASTQLSAQSNASRKALESAAAKGNLAATYALGAAAEAEGDFEKALTHFRAAAEAGYAGAEFKLGDYYENGRGVAVDLASAKAWYGKAAEKGLPGAIGKLKELDANVAASVVATGSETLSPSTDASVSGANAESPKPTGGATAGTVEANSPAPAVIQPSSTTPSQGAPATAPSSSLEIAAFFSPILVGLVMGFIVWKSVRAMVLRWYRSRAFFIAGRNAVEMMTNEVGLRLQVEWIPLVAGIAVLVGISVGGWKLFEVLFGFQM